MPCAPDPAHPEGLANATYDGVGVEEYVQAATDRARRSWPGWVVVPLTPTEKKKLGLESAASNDDPPT
ncbi:MAG TPA: hypothetical protein VGC15_21140 [Acetobacteraceae bacterium]